MLALSFSYSHKHNQPAGGCPSHHSCRCTGWDLTQSDRAPCARCVLHHPPHCGSPPLTPAHASTDGREPHAQLKECACPGRARTHTHARTGTRTRTLPACLLILGVACWQAPTARLSDLSPPTPTLTPYLASSAAQLRPPMPASANSTAEMPWDSYAWVWGDCCSSPVASLPHTATAADHCTNRASPLPTTITSVSCDLSAPLRRPSPPAVACSAATALATADLRLVPLLHRRPQEPEPA